MQKKLIVCSLYIVAITASAQVLNDSSKVVSKVLKREMYVNLTPFLINMLTENYEGVKRYSVIYKRSYTEKSAIRFGVMVDARKGYYIDNSYYLLEATNILNSGKDTATLVTNSRSSGSYMQHVNIGYEWIFGRHKLKWFYGCDLSLGHSVEKSQRELGVFYRDSTIQWTSTTDYTKGDFTLQGSDIRMLSVGLSPFFGAKYPISKHFLISAQVGFDAIYQNIRTSTFGNSRPKTTNISYCEFDSPVGFLNDVSLVYSF